MNWFINFFFKYFVFGKGVYFEKEVCYLMILFFFIIEVCICCFDRMIFELLVSVMCKNIWDVGCMFGIRNVFKGWMGWGGDGLE